MNIKRVRIIKVINPGCLIAALLLLMFPFNSISCQEKPPRPIMVVVTTQGLSFGAFTLGATGGSVTVTASGSRTSTGDVILLGMGYTYTPALYDVTGNPGTLISILNGLDVSLPGSNGGSMTLHIEASNPVSPFVLTTVPPVVTQVTVGGTLMVGSPAANPPGTYGGSFNITFIQE
jgi:hypothetical protein